LQDMHTKLCAARHNPPEYAGLCGLVLRFIET
jgi:hypothetical protein